MRAVPVLAWLGGSFGSDHEVTNFSQHERPREQVMQRLLAWREGGHQPAHENEQRRQDLEQVPEGRPPEGDRVPMRVGDAEAERDFAQRALRGGALHDDEIGPPQGGRNRGHVRKSLKVVWCENGDGSRHRELDSGEQRGVDEGRKNSPPEPRVGDLRSHCLPGHDRRRLTDQYRRDLTQESNPRVGERRREQGTRKMRLQNATALAGVRSPPTHSTAGYVDTLVIKGEDNKGTFDPSGSHGPGWDRRPIERGGFASYVPRPTLAARQAAGRPKSFGPGRGVRLAGGGPLPSFSSRIGLPYSWGRGWGFGSLWDQANQRRRMNRPQTAMPITSTMSAKTRIR